MNKEVEPKPLIQVISEEEFLPYIQDPCLEFFRVYNSFKKLTEEEADITKKFYSHLVQEAEFLESFLDEHGARGNKTWYFFSEYVASIRNLGIAAFFVKHLLDRYPFYNLLTPDPFKDNFYADAQDTLEFLNHSILNLFQEAAASGKANGLTIPQESLPLEDFPEYQSNIQLPRNVSEDQVKDEEERVIDLCEKICKVAAMIKGAYIGQTDDIAVLKKSILENINEKNARMFANLTHNVQSDFDTHIKNTQIEHKHSKLKNLRGYVSLTLHLLEVVLWLSHFYERHEDDIRKGECKAKIATLVDKNKLLGKIVNFAFFYIHLYIQEGGKISGEILGKLKKTVRCEVPIPQPHGFHARPSTYVSLIARKHEKDIFLIVDDEKYNVKSVMSLLQAGGMIADKGYQMVIFEGDKRALDDIKILAEHNYCDDSEIPPQLEYLKTLRSTA